MRQSSPQQHQLRRPSATLPSAADGQTNRLCSSRLEKRHALAIPQMIFTRSPRRPRKMKICPEWGSSLSLLAANAASPLNPCAYRHPASQPDPRLGGNRDHAAGRSPGSPASARLLRHGSQRVAAYCTPARSRSGWAMLMELRVVGASAAGPVVTRAWSCALISTGRRWAPARRGRLKRGSLRQLNNALAFIS